MNGILCIDKPQDYTSFDIVAVCRRLCSTRKIGHTGTLDPMATGVLVLLIGNCTKALNYLPTHQKSYIAKFIPGISSDTDDIWGQINVGGDNFVSGASSSIGIIPDSGMDIPEDKLESALKKQRGEALQIPPMYSAVKINGKRLYELARQGKTVKREPRPVNITRLEFMGKDEKTGEYILECTCSPGTYIRSVIRDIGKDLGCGAVMTYLRRTEACGFSLSDCITLDKARELSAGGNIHDFLLPAERVFDTYPFIELSDEQAFRFFNGAKLEPKRLSGAPLTGYCRVYNNGRFLGLGLSDQGKNNFKQVYLDVRI